MRAIPYALLTLSAIFGYAVAWVLNQIWIHTFGAFFRWLGGLGIDVPIGFGQNVGVHPFGALLDWNNKVQAFFSGMVAGSEHALVRWFHQTVAAFGGLAHELGALAETVERRFVNVLVGAAPKLITQGLKWLKLGWLFGVHSLAVLATKALHALRLGWIIGTHTLGAFALKALRVLKLGWLLGIHKLAVFMHKGLKLLRLGWLLGIHSLEGLGLKLFKALKLGALVGAHDLKKLVHRILIDLGLAPLFAANVARGMAWMVKQDVVAVFEFVKDAVEIIGTTDMCKLAAYQFDLAVFIFDPVMQALIGVTDWFCFHSGDQLPSATKGTSGYLLAWAPSATPPIDGPYTPQRLAPDLPLPRGVLKA